MKKGKWFVVGAVAVITMLMVAGSVALGNVEEAGLHGDINGDGLVNSTDIEILERVVLGIADINGDGEVNMGDVTALELLIMDNPGDANEDGEINMGDVTKVERIILQLDEPTANADANQDGSIDMGDVTYIERMILGLV